METVSLPRFNSDASTPSDSLISLIDLLNFNHHELYRLEISAPFPKQPRFSGFFLATKSHSDHFARNRVHKRYFFENVTLH